MANVTYKISGKADNSAITQTQNALGNLSKGFNSLKTVIGGFVALKAFGQISKGINDTVKSFSIQQDAIAKLTTSINNNSKLTEGSLKRIIDYSSQLQKKSIYGDEEIQKQATYLANLNLTESQIQSVLQASVDMASSGMMPLDTAIKNMSKTFGGMAGELGEKIPALRELTAEQLKSGEAIGIIQKQFAGMAEDSIKTLSGKQTQFNNIVGDVKEKLGVLGAMGKLGILDGLIPIMADFDKWLESAIPKILNFFLNIPQIGKLVFASLGDMLKIIFTLDFWANYWKAVWDLGWTSFKSLGIAFVEYLKVIGLSLWKPIEYGFYRLAKDIELVWNKMINFISAPVTDLLNLLIDGINKLVEVNNKLNPFKKFDSVGKIDNPAQKSENIAVKSYDEYVGKAVWEQFQVANGTMGREMGVVLNKYGETLRQVTEPLAGTFDTLLSDIDIILSQDLPQNIKDALTPIKEAVEQVSSAGKVTPIDGFKVLNSGGNDGSGITEYGNQLAEVEIAPTWMDKIGSALNPLMDMFKSLGSIKMILDPLQVVFAAIFDVLSPIIDSLLRPLMGIFQILGETVGKILAPALQFLTPVIELIAKAFVFLYNYAIMPFSNMIIWVVSTVYNMVANLVNSVIGALNRIPFVYISWRMGTFNYDDMKLEKITESDLDAAGSRAGVGSQGNGGSSASYSGSRDITVNVSIDRSAIADLRDIAILIRDEIKAAEALQW